MLTRIAIYCFLYPLSLLPLRVLYAFSAIIQWVVCDVCGYRKQVVKLNLRNSFPDYPERELLLIEKQYYRHLCDLVVEGVKELTLSRKQVMKRYRCINPEVADKYFAEGKSVILLSSHYNNWEWMVLSLDMHFKAHGVGVGKANSNKDFETLINKARTRYGTEVVFADRVRTVVEQYELQHTPCVYMMLSDQSPANVRKAHITTFLHQPSAMIYGGEYFARKYDMPVLYYAVHKVKRGYYEFTLEPVCEHASELENGAVVEHYVHLLQRDICHAPQYWLWSHRRWKRRKEVEQVMKEKCITNE